MDARLNLQDQFNHWLDGPQGSAVSRSFGAELSLHASSLRGNVLLQLGGHIHNPWLTTLAYQQKWVGSVAESFAPASLQLDFLDLPFDRHSVDCVLMPLTLECQNKNESYLFDEIDRVTKSSGYVVIWGVNPWGFWGIANRCNLLKRMGFGQLTCRSPMSIKRALVLRDFYVCSLNGFYFLPPVGSMRSLQMLEVLNEVGMMLWPFPASFYCLVMQKMSPIQLTPILNIDDSRIPIAFNSCSLPSSFSQKRKLQSL